MWPFEMTMGDIFGNQMVQVLLAEGQEVVQTLLAYALNPSLD